jgi:hypothetical protein
MASGDGRHRPSRTCPSPISEESNVVLYLIVAMLVSLAVAGLVVAYVAYPHRGEKMPAVPWLGDALGRAADAAPVLSEDEVDLLKQR